MSMLTIVKGPLIDRSLKKSFQDFGSWPDAHYGCELRLYRTIKFLLYNNQINVRAVIGQSAVVYYASKPMEKSHIFRIIKKKR